MIRRLPPCFISFFKLLYHNDLFYLTKQKIAQTNCFLFQVSRSNSKHLAFSFHKDKRKEEIIPFKDNKEMVSIKERLIETFSDFVKVGNSYIKKTMFREYKPVSRPDENVHYILFKTSFGSIKVRFNNEEDLKKELVSMDQLFDVE